MLLIIFSSLIATLSSVSGDCDIGPQHVNIDWGKFTGDRLWYYRLHTPKDFDKNLTCVSVQYASPEGNISNVTNRAYDTSTKSHITIPGYVTNWTSTGWKEVYPQQSSFTRQSYLMAVDYDRYFIIKFCFLESNEMIVYVGFRKPFPGKLTVEKVKKELKQNNIDYSQLEDWPMTNCQ